VSSQFAAIGLPVRDQESFGALCDSIFPDAIEDAPPVGARHLLWLDRSGSAVAFHVNQDAGVECVTPFFAPPDGVTRWRVRSSAPRRDPECAHCGGVDCDLLDGGGQMLTKAAVQLVHFAPWEEWLGQPRTWEIEVAGFAAAPGFYPSRAALDEAKPWGEPAEGDAPLPRFADNAFIPSGLFGGETMRERAAALVMGRVERVVRRHVEVTDADFLQVRVATYPGPLDLVASPDDVARQPVAGDFTFAHVWLVGRPVGAPPEERRSLWSLLRGGR